MSIADDQRTSVGRIVSAHPLNQEKPDERLKPYMDDVQLLEDCLAHDRLKYAKDFVESVHTWCTERRCPMTPRQSLRIHQIHDRLTRDGWA